jgi:hypothetical protein
MRTSSTMWSWLLIGGMGCGDGGSAIDDGSSSDVSGSEESSSEASSSGGADTGSMLCDPPPLLRVADIPERASLADVGPDTLAAFEVDGDMLVGKFVRDEAAAEQAMLLWQELVLRIPTNQRPDLVQFNIFADNDPVAWVDGTGVGNQVGRYGFTVAFSADNFDLNPGGPCAPLSGRRGTFDWTLIHEYHHLRGRADGSIDAFTFEFPHQVGDGDGYPEDGTPLLDRDYVTSYAERSSGDEDAAETFTTYVMLADLPAATAALATTKVRWFDELTGYPEVRRAIRVSEDDGEIGELTPVPRFEFPFEIAPPSWLHGTWRGVAGDGVEIQFRFEPANVTYSEIVDGEEVAVSSYETLRDDGTLATITEHVASDELYSYTKLVGGDGGTESFERAGSEITATLERLGDAGTFTLARQ